MGKRILILILLISSFKAFSVTYSEVYAELVRQEVKHPEIVLKQAILETGWFTSNIFKTKNNLFGMTYHNGEKRLFQNYTSWRASIAYYKKWQMRYYKSGDYYDFLECVYKNKKGECKRYATSPTYISKLKSIKVNV